MGTGLVVHDPALPRRIREHAIHDERAALAVDECREAVFGGRLWVRSQDPASPRVADGLGERPLELSAEPSDRLALHVLELRHLGGVIGQPRLVRLQGVGLQW